MNQTIENIKNRWAPVSVKCTDTGIVAQAEVDHYIPRETLVVFLAQQRLTFKPGGLSGSTWVANAFGLEFTTQSPEPARG